MGTNQLEIRPFSYQDNGGEKVSVFDEYLNQFVEGAITERELRDKLLSMNWVERNYYSPDENSTWDYYILRVFTAKITTSTTDFDQIHDELVRGETRRGGSYSSVYAYWYNDTKKYSVYALSLSISS